MPKVPCLSKFLISQSEMNLKRDIISIQMDVTDKASILETARVIEEREGKLHILVNKYRNADAPSLKLLLID